MVQLNGRDSTTAGPMKRDPNDTSGHGFISVNNEHQAPRLNRAQRRALRKMMRSKRSNQLWN